MELASKFKKFIGREYFHWLRLGAMAIVLVVMLSSVHAMAQEVAPKKIKRSSARPWIEISGLFNVTKSDYGGGSYYTSRRITGSVGLFITSVTQFEVSYSDFKSTYFGNGVPKTTTKTWDRHLAATLNQSLLPNGFFLQPFVKAGAAQLYRIQSVSYDGNQLPDAVLKQPSGVVGAGVRIYLSRTFSIKFQVEGFMPNFKVKALKDNYDWEAGLGIQF